jgi:hypothetical protein
MANKIAQVRFSDLNSASTRPGRQGGQGVDRTRAHAKQKPRSDGAFARGRDRELGSRPRALSMHSVLKAKEKKCRRWRCSAKYRDELVQHSADEVPAGEANTYEPVTHATHEWFAKDAWICDSELSNEPHGSGKKLH